MRFAEIPHTLYIFIGSQDFSVLSTEELMPKVQEETSIKRLVVGPLDVRLHSSAVHRILKMITCAMDHEYEPYCKPTQGQSSHAEFTVVSFTPLFSPSLRSTMCTLCCSHLIVIFTGRPWQSG